MAIPGQRAQHLSCAVFLVYANLLWLSWGAAAEPPREGACRLQSAAGVRLPADELSSPSPSGFCMTLIQGDPSFATTGELQQRELISRVNVTLQHARRVPVMLQGRLLGT